MSLKELSEFDAKSTHITGIEHYTARYRITRFEYLPSKMAEQVNQLHRFLKATQRIGRPIHIFRGLPTANRAFFYYDAMPSLLAELLSDGTGNKNELRLEQIPPAVQRLEMAKLLLATWGYGYNALQLYANPHTRFKGICFAWCGLHEKFRFIASRLAFEYDNYFHEGELKMTTSVTKEDGVMVKLGKESQKIQVFPSSDSHSEQMIVLETCLYGLKQALKVPKPQTDRNSLINGIAGLLEETLKRRKVNVKYRIGEAFTKACIHVATFFVDQFWIDVMNQRFPDQDNLRFLKSVYRMSFMRRAKKTENGENRE